MVRSEKCLPIPATTDSGGLLPTQGHLPPSWRGLGKEGRGVYSSARPQSVSHVPQGRLLEGSRSSEHILFPHKTPGVCLFQFS